MAVSYPSPQKGRKKRTMRETGAFPNGCICHHIGFRGPWRGTTYMVAVYQGTSVVSTSLIVVHIWWKKGGFLGELVLISSLHFCNWFKTMIQRESPFDRACTTGWITWGAQPRLFRGTQLNAKNGQKLNFQENGGKMGRGTLQLQSFRRYHCNSTKW